MDIAMCRIDITTNEVEYSGAHRPLYHLHESELIQYKGSKFPIGGNQYAGKIPTKPQATGSKRRFYLFFLRWVS